MLYTLLLIVVAALAAGGLLLGFSREPSLRAAGTGILGLEFSSAWSWESARVGEVEPRIAGLQRLCSLSSLLFDRDRSWPIHPEDRNPQV
jgi:hypothetical protein